MELTLAYKRALYEEIDRHTQNIVSGGLTPETYNHRCGQVLALRRAMEILDDVIQEAIEAEKTA